MTDRELLESAAKAAGIVVLEGRSSSTGLVIECGKYKQSRYWNPLSDDSDALRLAVELQIIVGKYDLYANASVIGESDVDIVIWDYEVKNPYAATRRAIVRAAAAMAKEKEE